MHNERRKTIHIGPAWRVILGDLGLDERAILRRAGLPPSLLEGDGSRISLDDYYVLHQVIEDEDEDATIALRAGNVVSVELFDPALFAAICSPDLNTAATRLGQFKRLVGPFSLDVNITPGETRLGYRCKFRPEVPMLNGLSEMVFLVAFARRATRHHIVPCGVTVQRFPSDLAPYEAFFECPVTQDVNYTVGFTARDASRVFLTHNVDMWKTFEPSLRKRMVQASDQRSVRDRVEAALYELLPSARTQMADVARELGLGTRTLQRRLGAEGTTWLKVLNQTRERLACHYLETTTMSPSEVSFLLGFDDPNSLFRAFYRWTGTTPEAWRTGAHVAG